MIMRQVATCSDGVGLCLQTGSDAPATRLWEDGVEVFTRDDGLFASASAHANTPRLTARERAAAFLSTIGIYGGAREDRLTTAFENHASATLARKRRRAKAARAQKLARAFIAKHGPKAGRRRSR